MAALCKAPTKSAGIGLSITAVCKNAGKKTLGQNDFFVVATNIICLLMSRKTCKIVCLCIFLKNLSCAYSWECTFFLFQAPFVFFHFSC